MESFGDKLKKEIINLSVAYIVFVTVLYYFFIKYQPDKAPQIFISYSVSIGLLFVIYWAFDQKGLKESVSEIFLRIFRFSFFFIGFSIILLGVIASETLTIPFLGQIITKLLIFSIFYPIIISVIYIWIILIKKLIKLRNSNKTMTRRSLTIFFLTLLLINAILFFVTEMNEIFGISFMILSVIVYFLNNREWGDKIRENLGIAIFAGLIISLTRDLTLGGLDTKLQMMYFMGLGISVLLLMKSASEGEDL